MSIQYISQKKKIYKALLKFIDCQSQEQTFNDFTYLFETQKISSNSQEMIEFFHLIMKISKNHHRDQAFFQKIEQIFLYLKDHIKQTFSNTEIFNFFSNSKPILLLLFKNNIIAVDKTISELILNKNKGNKYRKYRYFFFNEIKPFIN